MLASIIIGGKTADSSALQGTHNTYVKGLFISCSIRQDSGALSCTWVALVETGSVGEPGFFLRRFVMCSCESQRKGSLGSITCWFQVFSNVWLGTCDKPHSKDLSIGKAIAIFRFHKSMTREARRGERGLSCGSLHWHQVLSEPGHSFTSHESWMFGDWPLPLNWAPSRMTMADWFPWRPCLLLGTARMLHLPMLTTSNGCRNSDSNSACYILCA